MPGGATGHRVRCKPDIIQATAPARYGAQSYAPAACLLHPVQADAAATGNGSFLCEAYPSPGNITAASVSSWFCTGTPVIKSRWWLHCYPSTTVRKAPHEDYPERFNHVQKLLQSSVAFEACCSLDRQRGKEKELDVERAGWGWPVIAGKHSHTHEPKIKDWHIQSHFVLRICFSWLATWNRVTVTHFVSCTLSAMRDDRSFPAPSFSIKSKGCFAAIYLYFCVKRPWWPKGSEVYSCW